jgi:HlyD family secretion protein
MKSLFRILILVSFLFTGCGNNDDENTISASGNIEVTEVTVSSKLTGEVKKIFMKEGSLIEKGDTVLTINHETLDYQLKQAEAGVEAAEAQLKLLKSGAREEDKRQAEEMLRQAEIILEQAKKDEERMKNLYELKSVTEKQYEDAAARFESAQAQLNSAKENFRKMSNLARPEEIAQAEANLKRQKATMDLLLKNIDDSYVTSPRSGYIVKEFVEEGETVSMFASLFKVSDLSIAELVIYISEDKLGRVKLNQKADVHIDTFEDKTYEGYVSYISQEAEFTPKNIQTKDERTKLVFAVKIKIPNPDLELKAGLPADAVIKL